MKVTIKVYKPFKREAKRFSKHYASFDDDLAQLLDDIKQNPNLGTDLGNGIRKIRMLVRSKGKGKSGGMRVISVNIYATVTETTVNLLFIYDKAERPSIKKEEILALMRDNGLA